MSDGKTVQKWADEAMFTAEPIKADEGPKVYLLWMTPDPLAAIAAPCKIYKGEVARSLRDVSHKERQEYVQQLMNTKLQAPFEFVQFHFLIEGVTRAFTHQMVRQRTAAYAQESLRFAVKEDMPIALPPSLAGTEPEPSAPHFQEDDEWERKSDAQRKRAYWDAAVVDARRAYSTLVELGMPAEDARGLLPHNVLTRLHYTTNLRNLLDHAGNRLCTQAQFEWRQVFAKIAEAIRTYNPYAGLAAQLNNLGEENAVAAVNYCAASDLWQQEVIANLFRPVCYQTGKCEFRADFDRKCSIRSRVDANAELGRPSSEWGEEYDEVPPDRIVIGVNPDVRTLRDENSRPLFIGAIKPVEWLANPEAAR